MTQALSSSDGQLTGTHVPQRPIRARPGVFAPRSGGLLQPYNCVAEGAITWNDSP